MTPSTSTHEERQHERELDDALAARARRGRCASAQGSQLNLSSFFIDDSTWMLIWPPVKNGLISGVMKVQV